MTYNVTRYWVRVCLLRGKSWPVGWTTEVQAALPDVVRFTHHAPENWFWFDAVTSDQRDRLVTFIAMRWGDCLTTDMHHESED